MQTIPYIVNDIGVISVMIDNKIKSISPLHENYDTIKDAIKNKNWSKVRELINVQNQTKETKNSSSISKENQVIIKDNKVFYNNVPIQNTLSKRIINLIQDGFDISHMVKFLENLMKNPSYKIVNELYDFLEANKIPITENGTFLACELPPSIEAVAS